MILIRQSKVVGYVRLFWNTAIYLLIFVGIEKRLPPALESIKKTYKKPKIKPVRCFYFVGHSLHHVECSGRIKRY